MEVDVLYRVPKDLCWQYINRVVRPAAANVIFYRSCIDPYISKKTIWNAVSRIAPGGIFCIVCFPENISDIIRWIGDTDHTHMIVYLIDDMQQVWPVVVVYRSEIVRPSCGQVKHIRSLDEGIQYLLQRGNFGDTVVLIGDAMLPYIPLVKQLGREVIALGDDELFAMQASDHGVREKRYE